LSKRRGAIAIVVISETFFVRQGLADILRRAHFTNVTSLGYPDGDGIGLRKVDLAFVDVHSLDGTWPRATPAQLISAIRSRWNSARVVGLGTLVELAAHAPQADACVELAGVNAQRLLDIARAAARRSSLPVDAFLLPALNGEIARWRSLSRRERQVLGLLADGNDNLKIAAELEISESSIKGHVSQLLRKFQADNRAELALIGRTAGLPARGRSVLS